jgi:hypothetical protein
MHEASELRWEKQRFWLTAVGGVLLFFIGLWQFSITARNDFAKPLLVKQLDLCIEASEAAAKLAREASPDFNSADPTVVAYRSLYFGKLAVVEDQCVYQSMVRFKQTVFDKKQAEPRAALQIAFACRRMLTRGWKAGVLGIYDPQNLIESFNDLTDFKESMNAFPECKL